MLAAMPSAGRKRQTLFDKSGPLSRDRAIAALAERQHGAVATRQLLALGLTRQAIAHRAGDGRLHRVHQGVYAVGHAGLTGHGRLMAAVLAAGEAAVLSHASAAALWDLRRSDAERIDVSVRRSGREKRDGLRLHRPRTLRPDEITTTTASRSPRPRGPSSTSPRPCDAVPWSESSTASRSSNSATTRPSIASRTRTPGTAAHPGCEPRSTPTTPARPSRRASSRSASSSSAAPTGCRRRSSTRGRAARRSTSASPPTPSSSRRTAGRTTAPAPPSRTTAPATRTTPAPATAPCASRTASLTEQPATVAQTVAAGLRTPA